MSPSATSILKASILWYRTFSDVNLLYGNLETDNYGNDHALCNMSIRVTVFHKFSNTKNKS